MKKWVKIAGSAAALLVVAVAGTGAYVGATWNKKTFSAPEPPLAASTDPAIIEKGRYLAYGPAHCAYCHNPITAIERLDAGEVVPMQGGGTFGLPFGTMYSPNITPDEETGIGRYTDGQIARMLRHNVRPNGRGAVPFMEFQHLSDEDVVALLSWLRAQPPVRNPVPDHDLNLIGKALVGFVIKPAGPSHPVPATSPAESATVERGEYLVNNVANCAGCHSKRSMTDGSYTGPRLAGGNTAPGEDPATLLTPPNLTPDPKTGHITGWSEEQFLARFRTGALVKGTHMPWNAFKRMSDDDLRAIYRFLRTVPPVEQDVGPMVRPKE